MTILIKKDKRVLLHVTAVVLTLSSSWVVWVIKLFSELRNIGDGTRCGGEGDSRVILSKSNWFIALHIVI